MRPTGDHDRRAANNPIDTVTVTIGGKAPTHVARTGSIQSAIDAAQPGDLLMVEPRRHTRNFC